MAELTRRATTLIKEMLTADGKLPVYNVRLDIITGSPLCSWLRGGVFEHQLCADMTAGGGGEAGVAADHKPPRWHGPGR